MLTEKAFYNVDLTFNQILTAKKKIEIFNELVYSSTFKDFPLRSTTNKRSGRLAAKPTSTKATDFFHAARAIQSAVSSNSVLMCLSKLKQQEKNSCLAVSALRRNHTGSYLPGTGKLIFV